jgi:hypothetical protein
MARPPGPYDVLITRGLESLWEDGEFERYDPDDPKQASRLATALTAERGGRHADAPFFDLRPYEYQAGLDPVQWTPDERELRWTRSRSPGSRGRRGRGV